MSQNTTVSTKTVIKCSICSLTFQSVEQSKQHYHCVIPVTNYFLVPPSTDQQQTTPSIVNIQPLSINVSLNQGGNIQQANLVNAPTSIKLENFVCLPQSNQNITLTPAVSENTIKTTAQLNTTNNNNNNTQIIKPAVGVKRSHENETSSITKPISTITTTTETIQDTSSPTKKSRVLKTVLFPCTICGEKLMNVKKLVEHLNLTGHVNSMVCATCKTYIHGTESFENIQHHFSNCSTLTPNNKKVALIAASNPSSNANSTETITSTNKTELNTEKIIIQKSESKIIAIQDSPATPNSIKNQQSRHHKSKSLKAALKKSKKFIYFCATCCEKFGDKKVFDDHCKCCLHVSTVIQSVKEKLTTETMTANTPGYRLKRPDHQCSKPKKDEFICFACKGNFKSFQFILNHFEYCISIKTFMISVLDKCSKISKDKDDPKLFYCLDCSIVCNKLNSILLHIIKECNYHSKNYFGLKHAVEKNNTLGNDLILIFKISANCDSKSTEANYSVVLTCKKNEDAARIAEYAAEQNALIKAEKIQTKRKTSEREKDDIFNNTFSTQTNTTKNKVPTTKISIVTPEIIDINNEKGITSANENASEFSPENSKEVTTKTSLTFSLLDFIETQFKCLQCTSYFSSKDQLETHVKLQHKAKDLLHKSNIEPFTPLLSSNSQSCERLSVQVNNVMQSLLALDSSTSNVVPIKDMVDESDVVKQSEIKSENLVEEKEEQSETHVIENQSENLDSVDNTNKIEVNTNDIEINYLQFEDQDSLQEIANFGDLENIIKSLPASLNYESQTTNNNNYSLPVPDVIDKCQSQNFISTQIEKCIMEGLHNSFIESTSQTGSEPVEVQTLSDDAAKTDEQFEMPEDDKTSAVDTTINNLLNGIDESEIEKTLSMCLKNPDIMCSDAMDEFDDTDELSNDSPLLLVRPCYVLIDRNEVDQYFANNDDEEQTLRDIDEATTPENENVSFENIYLKNETFDLLDICVPDDFDFECTAKSNEKSYHCNEN